MDLKIAFFIIDHASVGGVERVTASLMSLFIAKNLPVHSLISLGEETAKNAVIHYPDTVSLKCISRKNIQTDLAFFLKKKKISHLIFQGDNMSISLAVLKAVNQTDSRGILQYHGSPYAYLKKNLYSSDLLEKPVNLLKIGLSTLRYPFKKRKLLKVIKNSKHGFVTVSNSVLEELNSLFYTRFKNVLSIHNPISFKQNKPVKLENKEPVVVFVARLERKHKNAFLSVKSWNLLYHKFPNWEMIIIGDGSLMEKMKSFKQKHQIQNLSFLGTINNVNSYLERSSIAILTSDSEGFGMGLFESASFKNALVTTESYGGVKDFVQENYNGFFVERNDHAGMAEKIKKLILDKNLREKMAINSYTKYEEIAAENIFKQWKNLFLKPIA